MYYGFSIGDKVRLLSDKRCRYYDYPEGQNLVTHKAGAIMEVLFISSKVRAIGKGDSFLGLGQPDHKSDRFQPSWMQCTVNYDEIERI